jgi:hypothetical protein
LHASLVVITTAGQEIMVQQIYRTQAEYLVMRGRMAGTTDVGRILLIPYDQINYLGFQKLLKEQEITAILEGTYTAAPVVEAESEDEAPPVEEAAPVKVESTPPPEPVAAPAPPKQTKPASKTVLLERVRARLAAQAGAGKPAAVKPIAERQPPEAQSRG